MSDDRPVPNQVVNPSWFKASFLDLADEMRIQPEIEEFPLEDIVLPPHGEGKVETADQVLKVSFSLMRR